MDFQRFSFRVVAGERHCTDHDLPVFVIEECSEERWVGRYVHMGLSSATPAERYPDPVGLRHTGELTVALAVAPCRPDKDRQHYLDLDVLIRLPGEGPVYKISGKGPPGT